MVQQMSCDPPLQIGRYRIESRIGAGGMGEVYLANDTKLDRKVALKILPADVVGVKSNVANDRVRRFIQEAKAASALNHPNIAAIHGLEDPLFGPVVNSAIPPATAGYKDVTLYEAPETGDPAKAKELGDVVDEAIKSGGVPLYRGSLDTGGFLPGQQTSAYLAPVAILSTVRKPYDYFTFNPWLKRLPEYLASPAPWSATS